MERTRTPMDHVAEDWLDTLLDLCPEWRVELGRGGRLDEYSDLSPDGHAALADAARSSLAAARRTAVHDDVDRVTQAELVRTLDLAVRTYEAGWWRRDLNVIASPVQGIREVFDLMPTDTDDDWSVIAHRLYHVPDAVDGYVASLRAGVESGDVPAIRQVTEVLEQVERLAGPSSFFASLAATGPAAVADDLGHGAASAAAAYARLAEVLRHELAPVAPADDAVGREHYALASAHFVGVEVDLEETYAWGVEELARTVAEQEALAAEILPGATVEEAIAHLDADPARRLHGADALQAWMQETSDRAVAALDGTAFTIPSALRRLECRIAPTPGGGIYYTPPSEDFSRPGRMWWSVPEGVTEFSTWRERTTVFHEGVPGHHLQCGLALAAPLNAWRRVTWNSGHGEGWALYAERLMADLGHLDDPADRLGMLDAQRMRAARVVGDIGVHLRLAKPDGTGPWTGDDLLPFLSRHVHMDPAFVRFEAVRYLGWPGQAPSYKVGQRRWEQIRDAWTARHGHDLPRFHAEALALGSVGLGTLERALLP